MQVYTSNYQTIITAKRVVWKVIDTQQVELVYIEVVCEALPPCISVEIMKLSFLAVVATFVVTLNSYTLAADMEGESARFYATSPYFSEFLKSTHYKMAHHGASDAANSMEWLEAIRPVEVHVSHMYNHGRYHHPRCAAFNRLMAVGSVGMASGAPGAKPHDLACFSKDEGYKAYDQCVYHRIFSTAPRKNKICWIVLTFRAGQEAVTDYYCGNF